MTEPHAGAPEGVEPQKPVARPGAVPVAPLPVRRLAGRANGLGTAEWAAIGASGLWLVLSLIFWIGGGSRNSEGGVSATLLAILGVVLPIVTIWIAAVTARTAREMRAEAQDLKAAVEAMRAAWISQQQNRAGQTIERKLDEVAQVARQTENTLATMAGKRSALPRQPQPKPVPQTAPDDQPLLALGPTEEDRSRPVSASDFVRALNFPDSAEDIDGIRALRAALEDRAVAKLIRAAQDVLNLLAEENIFMDDLRPDAPSPDLWRRFAQGERGGDVARIGAIRDRTSQVLTSGRMRSDAIFRDAVHHFLRQFDKTFTDFEKAATDTEIVALADTRTARAFMLLGRVSQIFD